MAKAIKVPTYREIMEYNKAFKEDPNGNCIADLDHSTMLREMTKRIFSYKMDENVSLVAWKFCKQLNKYAHAPVTLSEYKRMSNWLGEFRFIDVLFPACDDYYPDPAFPFSFDTIGFSYSVALLSQTRYRRDDALKFLDKLTQYYVRTKDDWYTVLLRNMKVLSKIYPDLEPFKKALESI